jgi:hypothetical protein
MVTDPLKQVQLGFLSGLVPKQKAMAFERILFRATRGNMLLRQESVDEPIADPQSGEKVTTSLYYQLAPHVGIKMYLTGFESETTYQRTFGVYNLIGFSVE